MSKYARHAPPARPRTLDARLHVSISRAMHDRLDQIGEETGEGFAQFVREAVQKAIDEYDATKKESTNGQ